MKRKIIISCICVVTVLLGLLINIMADMDVENSKMKVLHNGTQADDREEKLQEALEVDSEADIAIDNIDKDVEDQTFTSLRYAAYTDDGFYVYDKSTNLVSFVDKKTCKMLPLCSKPDCSHSYITCDAFYYTLQAIFAYDDKIYIVADDMETSTMCLYRHNKDGSERTLIKSLFAVENDTSYSFNFALHKGCLYMISDTFDDKLHTEDDSVLYCYSLDSKDKKEILNHKGCNASIRIVNFDGNNMYLRVFNIKNPNGKIEEEIKYLCYNIKNETMTELNVQKGYDVIGCYDSRILAEYSEAEPPEYSMTKYELHQLNINNNKDKIIYTNENFMFNHDCTDSKYQYLLIVKDEQRYLIVVSHDGKEVYRTDAKDYDTLIWSDKKDILLKSETTGKYALCNIKTGKIKEVCTR